LQQQLDLADDHACPIEGRRKRFEEENEGMFDDVRYTNADFIYLGDGDYERIHASLRRENLTIASGLISIYGGRIMPSPR
jgi:hypothetical protein